MMQPDQVDNPVWTQEESHLKASCVMDTVVFIVQTDCLVPKQI